MLSAFVSYARFENIRRIRSGSPCVFVFLSSPSGTETEKNALSTRRRRGDKVDTSPSFFLFPPLSLSLESAYLGPPLPEEKRRRRKEAFSSMRTFFFLVCLSVDLKPGKWGEQCPLYSVGVHGIPHKPPLSSSSYLFPSPVSPRHTIQCPALLIQRFHQREEE